MLSTLLLFFLIISYPRGGLLICGVTLFLLGTELFFLPFSTPETYRDKGVKKVTEENIKISKYFIIVGGILTVANIVYFIIT